jgi:hypothetical protein
MTDQNVAADHALDQPITAGGLLKLALAKTDLPPLGDQGWYLWLEQFTDPELVRRIETAIAAAIKTDTAALEHWVHQAEEWYLRQRASDPRGA